MTAKRRSFVNLLTRIARPVSDLLRRVADEGIDFLDQKDSLFLLAHGLVVPFAMIESISFANTTA